MPSPKLILLICGLACLASGCGLVAIRLPEEFKDKKLVQDPLPNSGTEPGPGAPTPAESKP